MVEIQIKEDFAICEKSPDDMYLDIKGRIAHWRKRRSTHFALFKRKFQCSVDVPIRSVWRRCFFSWELNMADVMVVGLH